MPKSIKNFTKERQELLQKMFDILGITDDNKMFSLKKLDENEEKQKQILDLVDDIKKYFVCSKWTFFNHKDRQIKREFLSLIKSIFRDMNVKMVSSFLHIPTIDNKVKCETYYILQFN